MKKQNYLTAVNDLFAQDMRDPDFAKQVKAEKNKLATAVAIRQEREAYGWTQQELAKRADLPQSTIARIESGSNTSLDTISKIANAFGKSVQITFA